MSQEKNAVVAARPSDANGCPADCPGCHKTGATAKMEGTRVLDLSALVFGDEAAAKLRAVAESGMTPEQLKAAMALTGTTTLVAGAAAQVTNGVSEAEAKTRAALLTAIQSAGAPVIGADTNASAQGSKDFMTLVGEYKLALKCTRGQAMEAVMHEHPDKHETWLQAQNSGKGGK